MVGHDLGWEAYSKSPSFYVDNRGKKSIVLDLKDELCLSVLFKLLETADVFLVRCPRDPLAR